MKLKRVLQSDYTLLALMALPAMLPLLLNAGLPNTADGVLHLYRTFELDRAWREGVFYPRIAPDFAYGYGYPIFNYYAPLFYFMVQALHASGISLEAALKAALLVTMYLYPLGMYLFARRWLPRAAALAAALAYLYAPYRFYEAFIQGDYPQFLALAIVPFCLWAVSREKGSVPVGANIGARMAVPGVNFPFIVAYAALVLSHNITALITTPLIGAYMLFVGAHEAAGTRSFRAVVQRSARNALAVALAVGLAAFFWLPALGEQRYVHIDKLTSGFFDFRKYFLSPAELLSPNVAPDLAGVNPYIPFNLGPVLLLLAAAGLVFGIGARVRGRAGAPALGLQCFCAFAALALAAMTLPPSTSLWEGVPLLALAEFPWRFVGVAAIPLAMLAGYAVAPFAQGDHQGAVLEPARGATAREMQGGRLSQRQAGAGHSLRGLPSRVHGGYVAAALIALIALDSFVYLFPRTPFLGYGDPALGDIARFELGSQALGTTSAAEYLPIWTQRRMFDSPLTSQLLRDAIPDHLYREALPVSVRVTPVAQSVEREAYRFESSGPLTVRVLRIYFPGWSASIDGQPVPLDLDAPTATMRVQMPAGNHLVDFHFGETVLRQAADGLSLATLVVCIGLGLWVSRKRPAAASGPREESGSEASASITGYRAAVRTAEPATSGVPADSSRDPHDGPPGLRTAPPEPDAGAPAARSYRLPLAMAGALLVALYFVAPSVGFIRYSRLPDIAGMQHTRDDRFGGELRLLGYDLPAASVRTGDTLALSLYWQPLRTIQNDYAVFAHLDNPLTLETVAQTLNDRPGNISTVELPLSLYVRDPHLLRVPESVEPGLYLLRVGVLNPRTGLALAASQPDGSQRTRVSLQAVRVRRAVQPDLTGVRTLDARIGPVELLGYTLDAQNRLALYWRAPQTPVPDATVFVHLLDSAGQTNAAFDGPPAGGLLPLSAWERYEIVADRRSLTPAPAGALRLAVGLYDPQTQQRLPAYANDGRRLANDEVIVERGP